MTSAGSVTGDERLRLFCALRLPGDVLDALVEWQGDAFAGVHGIRVVPRENLHLTLAFLGSTPASELEGIESALRESTADAGDIVLQASGYRETRSVGMLTFRDDEERSGTLAASLHERLERLGVYEREARKWLPHVTVIRFRRPPRLRPPLPDLGPVVPSDAAVYISRLHPSGARYEVLESVPLGG